MLQDAAKTKTHEFSDPDTCKDLELEGGAPKPDTPGDWSDEVALRIDKFILEQVEALEDKVAAASMQVPVRLFARVYLILHVLILKLRILKN